MLDFIIKYWLEMAFGGLVTLCGYLFKCTQKQKCENLALKNGVQALLRAQIIALYNKYIKIGEMPIYERENLSHLYEEYKKLNGNGVIESLVDKLMELPTPNDLSDRK